MSLFLVGGGCDDSLSEVYDEFVSQARHHNANAPVSYTHLTLPTIYSV